jgi:hypothetical protein
LFARAWESYVWDTLEARGRKNTYLVSGASEGSAAGYAVLNPVLEAEGGKTSVYPRGEERVLINAALTGLVEALREHVFKN